MNQREEKSKGDNPDFLYNILSPNVHVNVLHLAVYSFKQFFKECASAISS